MSFLAKFKDLWSSDPNRVEAPLLSFAAVPAAKMAQGESPFDDWHPADLAIPPEVAGNFKGCVWFYQMYVFYLLTEARLGSDVADSVLKYQVAFLDNLSTGSGTQLRDGIQTIQGALAAMPFEIEANGQRVTVPLEYAIAYAFFPESSFEDAASLASCLEHGKYSARQSFEAFINAARFETGTVTVQMPGTR